MAVQVSGVHLAGAEVDPEPLRGIKTFVRDILPRQSHASPEGGTTPVLGFEDAQCDNSHLKRKSCLPVEDSAESDVSDSEHLPSSKRQRITVSAMRRLFAKFSLDDTDDTSQPVILGGINRTCSGPSDGALASHHSPDRPATPGSDTEDNPQQTKAQHGSGPDQSSPAPRSEKRISETASDEEHGDKRQRTSESQTDCEEAERQKKGDTEEKDEENRYNSDSEETDKAVVKTSEETSKNNKRQADTRGSDTDDKEAPGSKVKRTRRLRRGLRLCTNITCYIEQVLYN